MIEVSPRSKSRGLERGVFRLRPLRPPPPPTFFCAGWFCACAILPTSSQAERTLSESLGRAKGEELTCSGARLWSDAREQASWANRVGRVAQPGG